MKQTLSIAIIALTGTLTAYQAIADTISLRADIWPPYNATPGSDKPGYIVEIATEIWNNEGHQVNYATVPWERAISEARSGTSTAYSAHCQTKFPTSYFIPCHWALIRVLFIPAPTAIGFINRPLS